MDEYELTPLNNEFRRAMVWHARYNNEKSVEYWMQEALKARMQRSFAREIANTALAMLTAPYGPGGSKASELMPRDLRELVVRFAQEDIDRD